MHLSQILAHGFKKVISRSADESKVWSTVDEVGCSQSHNTLKWDGVSFGLVHDCSLISTAFDRALFSRDLSVNECQK